MATTPANVYLYGMGMVTSVGTTAAMTAASVRAGVAGFEESSIYNKRFDPMKLALLPEDDLPPLNDELTSVVGLTSRHIRMLRLADPAMKETLANVVDGDPIPLFLAGPEGLPECPTKITDEFIDHLIIQTDANIERAQSNYFPLGRAGGYSALDAAMLMLAQGHNDYVIVGGVDSYLDLYLLGTLDMQDRVAAIGVMDGFIPGEAAGFILLASERAIQNGNVKPFIEITQPGIASEPGHRYSDQPYKGDGLANAFGIAIQHNGSPIKTVLASLNGESFGAKEYGVATLRNSADLDPALNVGHPADCFGDIGAAFAPVLIGLAAIGLQKAYINGPVLSYCSSENELRGATCINMQS